jgi:hypothetical protein
MMIISVKDQLILDNQINSITNPLTVGGVNKLEDLAALVKSNSTFVTPELADKVYNLACNNHINV